MPKVSLTTKIFIGLFLGVLLGYLKPEWGTAVRPLSMLFLPVACYELLPVKPWPLSTVRSGRLPTPLPKGALSA